jgi:hypothetical protein
MGVLMQPLAIVKRGAFTAKDARKLVRSSDVWKSALAEGLISLDVLVSASDPTQALVRAHFDSREGAVKAGKALAQGLGGKAGKALQPSGDPEIYVGLPPG